MTERKEVIGRLTDWWTGEDGEMPLRYQSGVIRTNSGIRYQVRASDIKGITRGPRTGAMLRGFCDEPGRVVDVEFLP